ncbi:hypothetical protein HN814_03615, partial [Candidatus Woesearchaeota archaeon]|nr:hypothetical protein [Candidatus Woesearchaeota archaeon]
MRSIRNIAGLTAMGILVASLGFGGIVGCGKDNPRERTDEEKISDKESVSKDDIHRALQNRLENRSNEAFSAMKEIGIFYDKYSQRNKSAVNIAKYSEEIYDMTIKDSDISLKVLTDTIVLVGNSTSTHQDLSVFASAVEQIIPLYNRFTVTKVHAFLDSLDKFSPNEGELATDFSSAAIKIADLVYDNDIGLVDVSNFLLGISNSKIN